MRRPLVLAGALLAAACSTTASIGAPATSAPAPVPAAPAPAAPPVAAVTAVTAPTCATYAVADPGRPVMSAHVVVDGRTVSGWQRIAFTPDLPVSELVLRLWGQAPRPAAFGGRVLTAGLTVDGRPVRPTRPSATLLRVPYRGAAGRTVVLRLSFKLVLPTGADDRLGVSGSTRWFGSGLPLLAWERGVGWATEPGTAAFAEAATSEVMRVERLAVTRAPGLTVLANGQRLSDDGRTTVFRADRVRDTMVAVGAFRLARGSIGGRPLVVGVASGVPDDPREVLAELARSGAAHVRRFGAFPFPQLTTVVVPVLGGGVEYPGGILLGTGQQDDATASHEVAHQWFYGSVGNDQARDPWLDEAFATYAEALDRGTGPVYASRTVADVARGRVGAPMTYWERHRSAYFRGVYLQGGVALLKARTAAGPAAFDAAVRCYVRRQSHQVATPADVLSALRHLPGAVTELRRVGALPR